MKNKEIDRLRFQGYGYKKIALLLGLSENTVNPIAEEIHLIKRRKFVFSAESQ